MDLAYWSFPNIDPVLVHIGPLAIRWYALAYIAGLFGGLWYMLLPGETAPPALMTPVQVDDLMLWILGGIVLGGRLGYVLFYKPVSYYFANPVRDREDLGGRHVVPRRPAGRDRRHHAVRAPCQAQSVVHRR